MKPLQGADAIAGKGTCNNIYLVIKLIDGLNPYKLPVFS